MKEIPKIIHQVWVGPHSMPEPLKKCIETVKKHHPDWEYHLWTDENIPDDFCLKDELRGDHCEQFQGNENGLGRMSDVLRLGMLWQYGGVYLDTDMEALKPIDTLLEGLEFFLGCEHGDWKGCAILGSAKESEFLEVPMRLLKERHTPEGIEEMKRINAFNGPKFGGPAMWNDAWHIDREKYEGSGSKAFESKYFYPWKYDEGTRIQQWQIPSNPNDFWPELHMIHHWSLTWMWQDNTWQEMELKRPQEEPNGLTHHGNVSKAPVGRIHNSKENADNITS